MDTQSFQNFCHFLYMSQMFLPNLIKNTSVESQTFSECNSWNSIAEETALLFCVLPDIYRCPLMHQFEHKLQNQVLISKVKIQNFQNLKFWYLLLCSKNIFLNSRRVVLQMEEVSWDVLISFN